MAQETLDARTEYTNDEEDGRTHHRINQYVIKEEIGRGSYGAVHLATDHTGTEFVRPTPCPPAKVKETSLIMAPVYLCFQCSLRLSRSFPRPAFEDALGPTFFARDRAALCASSRGAA